LAVSIDSNNGSLPHSDDAEKGLLCSLMLAPHEVALKCALRISAAMFHGPAHGIIYEILLEWTRPDEKVEFVWLKQTLEDRGQLDEIGGVHFLNELCTFSNPALADYYIRILREKYALRRCKLLCDRIAGECADREADPMAMLAEVQDEIAEIYQSSNGATDGLPEIKTLGEIIAENIPRPREIIASVLHQSLKLMLGGPSKARKTWLLMHLALAIATGQKWLGHQCTKGSVLYVNFELPEPFFRERALWILKQMGIKEIPTLFHELNLRGYAGPAEEILPKVARKIKRLPPLLAIVIDPTYKLMGSNRDENSAVDIASLMNEIDRLAVETGASVISAAHFAKGNASAKEAIDRISGSGVFGRDPDSILMMSPLNTEGAFQLHFILRCLPPKPEIAIKWNGWCFELDDALDPTDLKKAGGRPAQYSADELLEVLADDSLSAKNWFERCQRQHNMSKSSFDRRKSELAKAKRVYFLELDNTWSKSPKEANKNA
jgi:AAA domain/DnaB-like helicase N terminal domain